VHCGAISGLLGLTELDLSFNSLLRDAAIRSLTNLSVLRLNFATHITDDALRDLAALTELELRCQPHVTGRGIAHLSRLTALDLRCNPRVGDEALMALCSTLVSLDFGGFGDSPITPSGLGTCEHLTRLSLCDFKCCVDCHTVQRLSKLKVVQIDVVNPEELLIMTTLVRATHPNVTIIQQRRIGF
jgi:hypothetical protein